MLFVCHPKILHKHCLQFLLGVNTAPRETENNAYAKFWGDKQRALWCVIVFSGVVNFYSPQSSTVIKSKMAATTILQTRTRFRPPKIRLHCRLGALYVKNSAE